MFEQMDKKFNWIGFIVGAVVGVAGTFAVKLIAGVLTPKAK